MKKSLFIKTFAFFLVILCTLFTLSGCNRYSLLKEVEQEGDYTFRQDLIYTYKGNTFSISNILYEMRRKYKLRKGHDSLAWHNYTIIDDCIYVLKYFGAYKRLKGDYCTDAIVAKAPINNPTKIEVIDVLKKQQGSYFWLYRFYDLLIFSSDKTQHVYNYVTKEKIYVLENTKLSGKNDLAIFISDNPGEDKSLFILDKNYNEYRLTLNNVKYFSNYDVYKDYIIIESDIVYNYKTGKKLNEQESTNIIEDYRLAQKENSTVAKNEEHSFIYNGQTYTWENKPSTEQKDNSVEQSSSEDPFENFLTEDLVITNENTNQTYTLTSDEFKIQAKKVIEAVLYEPIKCRGIFVDNEELYFCYYYTPASVMLSSGKSTPSIVFKYDSERNKLVYIGYGESPKQIPQVFKGNIANL